MHLEQAVVPPSTSVLTKDKNVTERTQSKLGKPKLEWSDQHTFSILTTICYCEWGTVCCLTVTPSIHVNNKQTEGMKQYFPRGWGCSSVLTYHAQGPGFKPQHSRNQVCWCTPVVPATREVQAGGSLVQGHPQLQSEFKARATWDYLKKEKEQKKKEQDWWMW